MKFYYVYILLCSNGFTYKGITENVTRRFNEHQDGMNPNAFTFKRRPVQLIFQQDSNDVLQAIYFEKKIKKWSAEKKLALANGNFDFLQILAECRNATHYKYHTKNEE
ncbi:GIY-YIG nuclease family protein [Muricauda sp. SCSIO 64092]|uniref:GIY-YIG nuclease family protein n=1 Tax=Allomuricauda sp. SCSIO 64092 TaxID=2908842 RepID=UPI001FF26306|nr:GIY-YIG nuclease family protein [Muricauda sp. SCSIO 64092]UOY07275.1 GIY-YIG nuclease family protein [Muricauda sp. SCSIO 64092]